MRFLDKRNPNATTRGTLFYAVFGGLLAAIIGYLYLQNRNLPPFVIVALWISGVVQGAGFRAYCYRNHRNFR